MKKFVKGTIETVVDDNDRRIPQYLASGWKEVELEPKPKSEADERVQQTIEEVTASEDGGEKQERKGTKKVNAAIAAKETAHAEGEPVDDGLFKKGDVE